MVTYDHIIVRLVVKQSCRVLMSVNPLDSEINGRSQRKGQSRQAGMGGQSHKVGYGPAEVYIQADIEILQSYSSRDAIGARQKNSLTEHFL